MTVLTVEVLEQVKKEKKLPEWFDQVVGELDGQGNIEHILSHLGDMAAMAYRTKGKVTKAYGSDIAHSEVLETHKALIVKIAYVIRWGVEQDSKGKISKRGKSGESLIKVDSHLKFVEAVLTAGQGGLEARRSPMEIFTTNYDTLLEDAMALKRVRYCDGFSGGAVGFLDTRLRNEKHGIRAYLTKLHGSIDWQIGPNGHIHRVRNSDVYPEEGGSVMIYPQATKYVATQRDPFASQFERFRKSISGGGSDGSTLVICGYGFGDEHVNDEISHSLSQPENQTTVIAFSQSAESVPTEWKKSSWAERLYMITEGGVVHGNKAPVHVPGKGKKHNWWTFDGMCEALTDGFVREGM